MPKTLLYLLFVVFSFCTKAQITYVDVNPDTCICGSGSTAPYFREDSLDLDGDGIKDYKLEASWVDMNGGYGLTEIFALNNNTVMGDSVGAYYLISGDSINSYTNWVLGETKIELVNYFGFSGHWQVWQDGFLGIKFLSGGIWYYGWLRMNATEGAGHASIILKDYAYSINPILAGQGDPNDIWSRQEAGLSVVYPNPVVSESKLRIDVQSSSAKLRIFTYDGRKIITQVGPSNNFRIRRSDFDAGLYYYEVITEYNTIFRGKFVIE